MDSGSKEKAVKGVAWTTAANWGCQLLSFGFYTALARLLNPQTFGLVALASIYIAFIQIFVAQGFGMAIIQRRDLKEEHLDSAFWIAVATASVFCILSVMLAGPIARIFKEPGVASLIPWLSLTMLFNALCSVQMAMLTRELSFRPLAVRSLAATGTGGAVGVTMAFLGYGVWSLVGQQLVSSVIACICICFAVSWRPRLKVSRQHLRDLYGFSLGVAGNDVLWFFSKRSDQTVVGYCFGSAGLGPYSLASRVNSLVLDGIVSPLQSVAFPALSRLQHEPAKFARALQKYCETCSFIMLPVFAGIIAVAPVMVPALFGPKWISAVPLMQIIAVWCATVALLSFASPVMLAKGRAGFNLMMNVVLSCMTVAGCLVAAHWSSVAVAISMAVSTLLFAAGFLPALERSLHIKLHSILRAYLVPTLAALIMLAAVSFARAYLSSITAPVVTLVVCVIIGVATYLLAVLLIRRRLVAEVWEEVSTALLPGRIAGSLTPNLQLSESPNEMIRTSSESALAEANSFAEDGFSADSMARVTTGPGES